MLREEIGENSGAIVAGMEEAGWRGSETSDDRAHPIRNRIHILYSLFLTGLIVRPVRNRTRTTLSRHPLICLGASHCDYHTLLPPCSRFLTGFVPKGDGEHLVSEDARGVWVGESGRRGAHAFGELRVADNAPHLGQ